MADRVAPKFIDGRWWSRREDGMWLRWNGQAWVVSTVHPPTESPTVPAAQQLDLWPEEPDKQQRQDLPINPRDKKRGWDGLVESALRFVIAALFWAISLGVHALAAWANSWPTKILFAWSAVPAVATLYIAMTAMSLSKASWAPSSQPDWGWAFGCGTALLFLFGAARGDSRIWYVSAMIPVAISLLNSVGRAMAIDVENHREKARMRGRE